MHLQGHCMQLHGYLYYDPKTCGFDFTGAKKGISKMPEQSILLHTCAYNLMRVGTSSWAMEGKATVVRKKNFSVFFDMTYQGFATCDGNKDAIKGSINVSLCRSYAKNMGFYWVCGSLGCSLQRCWWRQRVKLQLKILIHPMCSNPPLSRTQIASTILTTLDFQKQWL